MLNIKNASKFFGKIIFLVLVIFLNLNVDSFAREIIQKPIAFTNKRIELTREYRAKHYGIDKKSIVISPKMIVIHWTEIKNFKNSFKRFYPETLSLLTRPDLVARGQLNVSAHYLIDRDGTIYQLMPDNWMARHIIGLNDIAIGIENVGGPKNKDNITEKQIQADIWLVRMLKQKYPTIRYLIGHYEYGNFKGTPLWQEKDINYFTVKADPGFRVMSKIRHAVKDLHLKARY